MLPSNDCATQEAITSDNVTIKVNAVIFFRVLDPEFAVVKVLDFIRATSQISQTTLRSVMGQIELEDLLGKRDDVNQQLQNMQEEPLTHHQRFLKQRVQVYRLL